MTPRKEISDIRREELTQATLKCIADKGYDRVTLDDVTREAGLSKGIASYYFKNRDEMISETVAYFTDLISKGFVLENSVPLNDDDRLSQGLEYIFSSAMINSEYTGFFLECCAEARHNPKVKASVANLFQRFRENIMEHLGGIAAFKHLSLPQKKMLASMIIAMHEGIELQWFADPEAVSLEDAQNLTKTLIQKI